jgi:hypothetical protein
MTTIKKIVAGGQTGVDSAGLDAAIRLGIPHGGFCPKGRRSENGTIPECYKLTEIPSQGYHHRTKLNVAVATATLILTLGEMTPGSAATAREARTAGKPCLWLDLSAPVDLNVSALVEWLDGLGGEITLNVAGSRESKAVGIHDRAEDMLLKALGRFMP